MVDFKEEHLTAIIETRKDVEAIKSMLENGSGQMKDHETRIRSLESVWWKIVGAAVAIAAIVPCMIDYLKK